MIRIFKTITFSRWAKKEKITDKILINAVKESVAGLIDVKLGNGLFKKRIARLGQGKRKGHRTILAFRKNKRIIFLCGISKNDKPNISKEEEEAYKKLAKIYLSYSKEEVNLLCKKKQLTEITHEK